MRHILVTNAKGGCGKSTIATSLAAYQAALTKNQDAMVEASGSLSEACLACHRVYRREPTRGDTTQRCIPGPPVERP